MSDLPPDHDSHEPASSDAPAPPVARARRVVRSGFGEAPSLELAAPFAVARPMSPSSSLSLPIGKWAAVADIVLVIGVLLFTLIAPALALFMIDPSGTLATSPEIGLAVTVLFGVCVAFVAIILHRARRCTMASLGAASAAVPVDLAIGVGAFLVCLGWRMVLGFLMALFSPQMVDAVVETGERLQATFPKLSVYQAFAIATLIGVYEETVFRGFILPRMRRIFGSWTIAIIVSSVAFTLLHAYQGPMGMAMVLMLSLVLSVIFVWRRSLVPCIVAHAVTDFVSLSLLPYMDDISTLLDEGAAS